MSTGHRIPLHVARAVAERLVAALAPACERIEIAGSIRRGKSDVGDIELVAIPSREWSRDLFGESVTAINLLNRKLDDLVAAGKWAKEVPPGVDNKPAWGEKYRKGWVHASPEHGLIQVDVFQATAANWGAIFLIRTGPREFNQALMDHINQHTRWKQDQGILLNPTNGEAISTPEEADYFVEIGVPYIAPERRTAAELRRVIAAATT